MGNECRVMRRKHDGVLAGASDTCYVGPVSGANTWPMVALYE